MSESVRIVRVSVDDYLAGERTANVRHEYVDGELFAMTGANRRHNAIAVNLTRLLANHLIDGPCRVATADMKVRPAIGTRFYYPDLVVCCNDAADEPDDHVETRPTFIIEILSASIEQSDRREKRIDYQSIESLQEYVLVAQDTREISVYRRDGEDWILERFTSSERVRLHAVDLLIDVDDVYR